MEERLLEKLRSQQLDGFLGGVAAHLKSISKSEAHCLSFLKNLFKHAVKFYDGMSTERLPADVAESLHLGLQELEKIQLEGSADLTNVLYHVFSLLLKEKLFSIALKASRIILLIIQSSDPQEPKLQVIVANAYVQVWNTSLKLCQENFALHQSTIYELQVQAIQFLCLKDDMQAVADRTLRVATWCVSMHKQQTKVTALYETILPQVQKLLLRTTKSTRANVPPLVDLLLDYKKMCTKVAVEFSLLHKWEKLVDVSLFSNDRQLHAHIGILFSIVDQMYALHRYILNESAVPSIKLSWTLNWDSCKRNSEELKCVMATVNTLGTKMTEIQCLIDDSEHKQGFMPIIYAMLEFGPFLKEYLSHLRCIGVRNEPVEVALKVLRFILTHYMYIIQETKDVKRLLKILSKAKDIYPESLFEIVQGGAAQLDETEHLASIFYFLAYSCFQHKLNKFIIMFGKISIELHMLQIKQGIQKDKDETAKAFWKKCELLIWAYRQEVLFVEAMQATAKAMTAVPDMGPAIVARWVKTKRDITHPALLKRTLINEMEQLNSSEMTDDEKFHLLFMELNISMKEGLSSDICLQVFTEMEELVSKCSGKLRKCCVLVEKAHILWHFPHLEAALENTFEESCTKAVSAATMLVETTEKSKDVSQLLLATAHFWSFFSKVDSLRNMAAKELAEAAVDLTEIKCDDPILNQALAEEKDYSCDVMGYLHINLGNELDVQQALDEALSFWSGVVLNNSDWCKLRDDIMHFWFLDHIKVAAEVYASSLRTLEEVKTLTLWYVAAKELNLPQEQALAAAGLSTSLTKLGLVAAAFEIIQSNREVVNGLEDGLPKLRFLLARSQVLYSKEQFSEGQELVRKLLIHPVLQKKTKSCLMFLADAKLLACRFAMLPPASVVQPATQPSDTPINLAQDALKLAQSVLRHLAEGKQGDPQDLHTKFVLERLLLDSAATLGSLYINIGAAREAYCFLKEYLQRAQQLVSSTSCGRLILLITQMDLLCEKLHDVKVKLNGIELLLQARTFSRLAFHPSNEGTTDCPVQLPSASTMSHRVAVSQFLAQNKSREMPSVPSSCRLESAHDQECSCHLCRCFHVMEMRLERNLLRCILYFTVGDVSVALTALESQVTFHDALCEKLKKECVDVLSFLKIHLMPLPSRISRSVGGWGKLLGINARILLHTSEVHLVRKSYSAALESAVKGLTIMSQQGGCQAYHYDLFASLTHQKVKVLLEALSRTKGSEGDLKRNSLWLCNVNEHAAENTVTVCPRSALSPVRQPGSDNSPFKTPNAPKRKKNTLDKYLRSLDCEDKAAPNTRTAAFLVLDEDDVENKVQSKPEVVATRTRSTRVTRQRALSRPDTRSRASPAAVTKTTDTTRQPQRKHSRAKRQTATTNLTPSSSFSLASIDSVDGSKSSHQQARGTRASILKRIEEEAVTAVVRSSLADEADFSELPCTQHVRREVLTQEEVLHIPEATSLDDLKLQLEDALQLTVHFPPCPLYSEMCRTMVQVLALQEKCSSEHRHVSSWYLSQTAAVTLQHLGLNCLNKTIRRRAGDDTKELSSFSLKKVQMLQFKLLVGREAEHLTEMLDIIPSDWTVVQITAADTISKTENGTALTPDLLVCQYRKGKCPITVQLSGSSDAQFHRCLFDEYKSIMSESVATMKTTDPALWWSIRRALDKRLKELTESIENVWMGCWKCVFNGKPVSSAYHQALNSTVTQVLSKAAKHKLECCSKRLLEAVVDSVGDLSVQQLSVAICQLFGITSTHLAHNALVQIMECSDKGSTKRHPVVLILGKTIQGFPWESVPILRKNSVSRVPSLAYLHAQLHYYQMMTENVYIKGIDSRKTYFILNPSNDIPKTQAQFEEMFRREGWPGVCGKPPGKEEFQSAIAGQDLILYCGHGSGREYLCGDVIEQMLCHACPVLMGCGSGRLKAFGSRIEPVGVVLQYWLGGSPCVVANLWEVTDRDIDRFTEELLRLWIPQLVIKDHVPDVTTAVQSSRKACKLQHLVGAAPVVYGIPVVTLPFKSVQFDKAA